MVAATVERDRQILAGVGGQVARFAQEWIVQTKGRWAGRPLELEPWQREVLDELFLVYEDGERVYSEALIGVARKNGKSTLSSAIALYLLLAAGEQGPEVYAAAASKDQARIVFQQAVDFVERSPRLRDWLTPQRNVILCKANGGVFRVLSSDAPLQYGLNPSAVVIDELWAHQDRELYDALTTAQGARENSMVVNITTAGFDRDSICYELYERGRRVLREGGVDAMRESGLLFRWFQPAAGLDYRDESGWLEANPSSWISVRRLRREAQSKPESVFRRLYLNEWTETEDAWIKPHEWDACAGRPKFDPALPTWAGIDVGVRRDSAAFTWVQWHEDRLHVGQRIWLPEKEGATFGVADVRGRVAEEAARMGALREVVYDPWQFRESAEILLEAGLPMVEFPQTAPRMAPASEQLYELVVERRILHDGDELMRQQVLAGVPAPTDRGGWRISKRKSLERIDALISLAMSSHQAVVLRHVKPPRRGVMFH